MKSLSAVDFDTVMAALDSVVPHIADDDDANEIMYTRDLFEADIGLINEARDILYGAKNGN